MLPADAATVAAPGADSGGVLPPQHSRELHDVIEVVRDPGGEQLTQRHDAELGMTAAAIEVRVGQSHRRDLPEVFLAERRKLVQQARERPALRRRELCEAIEL